MTTAFCPFSSSCQLDESASLSSDDFWPWPITVRCARHDGGSAAGAADFEQFEAQRFELGQQPVQRRLVSQWSGEYGLRSVRLGVQIGERAEQQAAQHAADADLIADRLRRFVHDVGVRSYLSPRPGAV